MNHGTIAPVLNGRAHRSRRHRGDEAARPASLSMSRLDVWLLWWVQRGACTTYNGPIGQGESKLTDPFYS